MHRQRFLAASQTGKEVLVLKAVSPCLCFDPDDLVNSEPSPHCEECFGTGKKRRFVFSDKIRYDLNSDSSVNKRKGDIESNDQYSFFFSDYYSALSGDDLIVIFDSNGKAEKMFEIKNKFEFTYNEFLYLEVYGNKIHFMKKFGEIFEYRN